MDTRSTNQRILKTELYPANLIELMSIMDGLITDPKEKDWCLSICMMLYNSDADDGEELASFDDAFDMPLIDETLEYAKKKARTIKDISDFVWDRLPEIEIVGESESE